MYRIDNPNLIEVLPGDEVAHKLSDLRILSAAQSLKKKYLPECRFLLDFLLSKNFPNKAEVFVCLCECALQEANYSEALEYARKSINHNPEHKQALYLTALTLLKMGKYEEAFAAVNKVPVSEEVVELRKLISEKLEEEKESTNFNVKKYYKSKPLKSQKLSY